jgi:hypothetical protein
LVFVTGQHEVQMLVKKLSKRFPIPNAKKDSSLSDVKDNFEPLNFLGEDVEAENDEPVDDFEELDKEMESDGLNFK